MTPIIPPELIAIATSVTSDLFANLAADKFKEWWRTPAVQRAITATASVFPQYEALHAQLDAWVQRAAVGDALARFRSTAEQSQALLETLVRELEACGFDPAPDGPTTVDVLSDYLNNLSRALLEAENTIHTVAALTEVFRATTQTTHDLLKTLQERVADRMGTPLAMQPADILADAETLIREGKATAALEVLRLRENAGADRYKLLSTRGHALLRLGQYEEAEHAFREARTLNPTRATAVANVALARLFRDDVGEALELAEVALRLESDNLQALRVKAQALGKREHWTEALDIVARLPEGADREHLAAIILFWKGDLDEAIERFLLVQETQRDDPWLQLRLATALLLRVQQSVERSESGPWGRFPEEAGSDLERGAALLDAAVQLFDRRDDVEGLRDSLMQRAQLRASLGRDGASDDFERACLLPLPRKLELLEHASDYWNAHGNPSQTLKALDLIGQIAALPPSLVHRHAQALSILGRTDEAIAELQPVASGGDADAVLTFVDLLLGKNDLERAERMLEGVPAEFRRDWSYAMRLADIQQKRGDEQGALGTLRAALDEAAPIDRWRLRLAIADTLTGTGDWDSAAQEYDRVLTPQSPPRMLARLLECLFNAGRVDRFFELVEAINSARGFLRVVVEVEAHAREMLGQLPESDALYDRLLEHDPSSSRFKLRRAAIAYRMGKIDHALELLPPPESVRSFPWRDALETAALRAWLGDALQALETAYAAYRTHPTRAEVQLAYVQLFLSVDPFLSDVLNPTAARPGTWVTVATRNHEAVHKLLSPWDESRHASEHPAGDTFSTAIIDKKVGDTIPLRDDALGRETISVVAVRSQYVGAFQEILQSFESTFPGRDGLRGFTFRGAEDLPGMKRLLAEKRKHGENLAAQFRTMPMPWAMLARLQKSTDIDAWYMVIGNKEFHPVLVAEGSAAAQVSSLTLITSGNDPIVLETTSIAACAELGCLEALSNLGRPLLVAQTVLDQFQQQRSVAEDRLRHGDHMVLEESGGQIYRQVVTETDMRRVRDLWDRVLSWLRDPAKCRVMGVSAGKQDVRWALRELLTPGSADSLAIARDNGAVLLSEDLRLRQLGLTEFQCDGIATLHVLGALLAKGRIKADVYERAIIRMVRWGYYFVPVNEHILEAAFREDNFAAGVAFQVVADQLSEPTANIQPIIGIAARFIRNMMLCNVHPFNRDAAIRYVLGALLRRGNWVQTERMLGVALQGVMTLLPLHLRRVERDIEVWKQGQFLA